MASNKSKKIRDQDANLETGGRLMIVICYGAILGYYFFTVVAHKLKLGTTVRESHKYESLKAMKDFKQYFFTGWNFALQIIFLILAVSDEAAKLVKLSIIQRPIEKIRLSLFSSLVFPSSLLVMSVFWGIWHIDRELIFPKAIDDFYPPWLNHTLHTFIIVPLIVEVFVQFKNTNYRISRIQAAIILMVYCAIYQTLYMSVYFQHGVWLYPVYKVLTWTQRVAFVGLQFAMILAYQQIGISILKNENVPKTKTK